MYNRYSRLAYQSGNICEGEWHYDTVHSSIEKWKLKINENISLVSIFKILFDSL